MGFTFHIQHHTDPATERTLGWITDALRHIIEGQRKMGLNFSELRREIGEIGTDLRLIGDRLGKVTVDPADQATIDELTAQLDAHGKAIEAILAQPAPGEPVPQPPADPSA